MNMYTASDEVRPSMSDGKKTKNQGYRSEFNRDYARILHSPSFRRLQGKTQLFPCMESDFFRNRLTHSLEVAQIARSIALRLNSEQLSKRGSEFEVDLDLVQLAALAHDIGHPPFGHQGEEALNDCMQNYGGFEGNAQTLRIISKLEKKVQIGNEELGGFDDKGEDKRLGLDLTYRSLASVLKYDQKKTKDVFKGYYYTEDKLVEEIKHHVLNGRKYTGKFKTLECSIMDIADDIAYSTFDLEDVFKSGFLNPIDTFIAKPSFFGAISFKVTDELNKHLPKDDPDRIIVTTEDVFDKVSDIFEDLFDYAWIKGVPEWINSLRESKETPENIVDQMKGFVFLGTQFANRMGKRMAEVGYLRTGFTSKLINEAVNSVEIDINEEFPALSSVYFPQDMRIKVEILKQLAFRSQILSPKLKVAEYRGKEIVRKIFKVISISKKGYEILPDDVRTIYEIKTGNDEHDQWHRKRVVCDFIASMTDRYAIEFYGRLTSENPETIFKPF